MKKLLLSTCLALVSITSIPTVSANVFSAETMSAITLDSLNFKDVMRGLYAGKMTQVDANDDYLKDYSHIGLKEKIGDNENTLAIMHPVLTYKNNTGENRHLVVVEKVTLDEDGSILSCTECSGQAEVFLFKQTPAGKYALVSRSHPDVKFKGDSGHMSLNLTSLATNIVPLGSNRMGSIIKESFCEEGTCYGYWQAFILSEDDYIQMVDISDASGDNSGIYQKDSPLSYAYDSTIKIINNNSNYYPIEIHYKGDKPMDEDESSIKNLNHAQIFSYDVGSKKYN